MKTRITPVSTGRRTTSGQALAEFTIAATVFILLLFGVMELALGVYYYNTVSSAAREAVRYAIVHSPTSANPATNAQIQAVATNYAVNMNPANLSVSVNWPADANLPSQSDAQVQVSYNYQLRVPFLSPITMTVSSTSQMLVSQ